jgi:hypothetical protein
MPGDLVRLRKNVRLMSGWRGAAIVISDSGGLVDMIKLPDCSKATVMRGELVCIRRAKG